MYVGSWAESFKRAWDELVDYIGSGPNRLWADTCDSPSVTHARRSRPSPSQSSPYHSSLRRRHDEKSESLAPDLWSTTLPLPAIRASFGRTARSRATRVSMKMCTGTQPDQGIAGYASFGRTARNRAWSPGPLDLRL